MLSSAFFRPEDTFGIDLQLNLRIGTGMWRESQVIGKDRWMPKWAGEYLALRTPRAMECVWGDRKDTLSTTTEFTTMRMVTTMRKVRYLSRVRQAGDWMSLRHLRPRCHPPSFPWVPGWKEGHCQKPQKGRGVLGI
jgi:hypothetical protein